MGRDLQERIRRLIVDRRLPPGAVLPTEPELMTPLGAGRNSVREAVETGLVSRLASRVPERDLVALDALVDRMEQETGQGAGLAETDRAFHATLYRGLGNALPSEVLGAFRDAFHRVRTDLVDVPRDPEVICRQHREILDAVRSGDAVPAKEAMRQHFLNFRTQVVSTAPEDSKKRLNERV
ncbi:FadR/GntR family transcriptional regulator [Streptomyces sp. TP-A0356]|uniref:FadR/GntR family transcriptional regulator n=1 Tax=Streptomyces sp. TP-A0356 TaxID=1359208 RepID=UPI0006E24918|nr:FCD domain-containing protein [Streptomyces sp. TP-A0356]